MTTLPPTLNRFGAELELAVQRDLRVRTKRRRLLRAVALPAAAAAAALGVLAVLMAGGSSVVGRAAAALEESNGTILHIQMRGEQHNPDGSVVTWRSESWNLNESPYTNRKLEVGSDGIRAETLVRGDTEELYDAQANTIYVATDDELAAARPLPKIKIVSASRLRKITRNPKGAAFVVYGKKAKGYSVIALTKAGAERLRRQRAQAAQRSGADQPNEESFRAEILKLLKSGGAQETGRVEVDGRDAIRIESPNGRQVYLVDPDTYAPIEWTTTGNGGSVTLSFPVYEELQVNAESMKLVDLEAQYPQAQVVHDTKAYLAAEARLFPHG